MTRLNDEDQCHAEDGEKGGSAIQNLCALPETLQLAEEMGTRLGKCSFLFGPVQVRQMSMDKHDDIHPFEFSPSVGARSPSHCGR